MHIVQVILYVLGIVLLVVAAFGPPVRVSLALLGAASLALGYVLPAITGAGG